MTKNEYKTINRIPTIEEYKNLCTAVGWEDYMNFDVAEESLKESIFSVVIQFKDEIVGMGRVVGDGKIYFYIQDVAVDPEHQNKGLGSLIMVEITEYLKENAPEKSFVGLFASEGKESFYTKYGFNKHEGMTGMFGVIHESEIK
ncbi:GNAT family N-acetyltransferase [Paenibacillus pinistramenti]|uniref:GNAT family N-acetyltransferase n=1 Tax=Paenibacillus pinistramenti TaxID=1768003 RepID=UPI00110852F4|nr:GNAT family N-acetyltransferase [Paenibacillus pinistramenti]